MTKRQPRVMSFVPDVKAIYWIGILWKTHIFTIDYLRMNFYSEPSYAATFSYNPFVYVRLNFVVE